MSSQSAISNQQSESEVLVRIENVGKIFCRDLKKSLLYGLKDSVKDLIGGSREKSLSSERRLRKGEFWANKGVSFELRRGECIGLIGHNGAGKTTTLRMLATILKPTSGSAKVNGFDVMNQGEEVRASIGFLTGSTGLYQRLTPNELVKYLTSNPQIMSQLLRERLYKKEIWVTRIEKQSHAFHF